MEDGDTYDVELTVNGAAMLDSVLFSSCSIDSSLKLWPLYRVI